MKKEILEKICQYHRRLKENPSDRAAIMDCVSLMKQTSNIGSDWELISSYCHQRYKDIEAAAC